MELNDSKKNETEKNDVIPPLITPHDRFGRKTLNDPIIAADFLREYNTNAAVIVKYVDLNHLKPEKTNFFGPAHYGDGFKQVSLDVPYSARLCDEYGGSEVLMVFEHKSTLSDFTPLQLDTYVNLIMYDKWIRAGRPRTNGKFKLPLTFAAIVYCGATDVDSDFYHQNMYEFIPEELREFISQRRIIGINLNRFDYDNLRGRPETRAVAETMKRAFDGTLSKYFSNILEYFRQIPIDERIEDLIVSICAYSDVVSDITPEQIDQAVLNIIQGQRGIQMTETVRKGIWQSGFESGEQTGEQRGELKGKISAILTILRNKFGQISPHIVDTLNRRTDAIALDSLLIFATACSSLDDFVSEL
jgi:hypothetical protein